MDTAEFKFRLSSGRAIRFGESTGLAGFFSAMGWGNIVMIGIAFFLLYLAIRHKFEPLLLLTSHSACC